VQPLRSADRDEILREHERTHSRFLVLLAILILGSVLSVFVACLFGRLPVPVSGVLKSILAGVGLIHDPELNPTWKVVVFDIRFSRVCLSAVVGLGLAVAGAAFQGILRNPLADPFTIGVSTGAAFGASLGIFMGLGGSLVFGVGLLPLASLGGALGALFTVIALSRIDGQIRRSTMVLAGIVVATFLSALISLVKSLDEESVASIVFWVMGSFQGRGWIDLGFASPYMVAGLVLVGMYARELDLLSLGDLQAQQLGVDVNRVRLRILVGASLVTAAAVSVSGVIGFVGLVVPHLIRMTMGPEHRSLLILSGLLGAITLTWSDVLARIVLSGGEELPVGVVTALLGGPFFCLLLKRKRVVVTID
jgi:iron complex transport system permease protein